MKSKVFDGALNQDVTPKFLKEEDYVGASNIIFQTSKDGSAGLLRRYPGFAAATATAGTVLPASPSVIGTYENRTTRLVYFFVNGSDFDGIYKYNPTTNIYTKVIVGQLNLSALYKVTGIGMIGDYLYWTDNLNQPRMINVASSYATFVDEDITLIKPAPMYPLLHSFVTDALATYSILTGKVYQFSYRYLYPDNQISVIAPYTSDIFCAEGTPLITGIKLVRPTYANIPASVVKVQILVRRSDQDQWQIFKTMTRTEFFNNTDTVETIVYADDLLGIPVATAETIKYFESVPLKSRALEIARDRVFLGNNTEGYDLYQVPSLTATLEESDSVLDEKTLSVYVQLIYTKVKDYYLGPLGETLFHLTETWEYNYFLLDDSRYYFFKTGDITTSVDSGAPTTTRTGDYTGLETTFTVDYNSYFAIEDIAYFTTFGTDGVPPTYQETTATVNQVFPVHNVSVGLEIEGAVGTTKFKNGSQYQIGIVFYDVNLRNAGVYTNPSCIVTINDNFRAAELSYLRWDINALDKSQIPLWAHSYQIVRTDNLTKNSFYQGKTSDIYWVRNVNGEEYFDRIFTGDAIAIEIDISGSFNGGLRYNFTPGDLIDIELTSGVRTFEIISAVGSRLRINAVAEPGFVRTTTPYPVRLFYEIYQPKQRTADLIFYEVGSAHRISQPETVDRDFTTLTGFLAGDVVLVSANHYDYADSRNPSAGSFSDNTLVATAVTIAVEAGNSENDIDVGWLKGLGRLNAVLEVGQVVKQTAVRWSNRFIQGTRINGTSNFEVNDEKQLSIEVGEINKLQLASKAQQEGTVMLAICQAECVSLYLGETQFVDNVNQALIGSTVNVIGTVNVLNSSCGTIHPESVIHHNGRVWWWDFYNSRVLRYDPNGIRDLSELGMKSYFYGKGTPTVGYDPFHNLFFIGFGGDMLSFDENSNQWRSFYTFTPEYCGKVEDFMISFKNGVPHKSNHTNHAFYFGQQFNAFYEFYVAFPTPQILDNISLAPTEVAVQTYSNGRQQIGNVFEILVTNESGQETDLINTDFDVIESTLYAHFFRDKNSVGGLRNGEVMRGDLHKIKLTIKGDIGFETITINDTESSGH